jgi:hypothetical protein
MDYVEKIEFEKDGIKRRILIKQDECPFNPRTEFDPVGVLVGWGRYCISDKESDTYKHPSDFEEAWNEHDEFKDALRLPVSYYSHGMTMYFVGGPNDRWDSGQSGWVYCTRETIIREWGTEPDSDGVTPDERATALMTAEVQEYSLWCQGYVYGFVIERFIPACDHGHGAEWVADESDVSTWGFIGEHPTYGGVVEAACEEAEIPVPDEFKERKPVAA